MKMFEMFKSHGYSSRWCNIASDDGKNEILHIATSYVTVNVFVYSLISSSVQQTSQCWSLVLALSHIYSLMSWENSAFAHFAAAISNHYNWASLFNQVPITAGWTEAAWYERLVRHLYTYMPSSVTGAPVTHPSINQARRCLTSVIWRKLVTTWSCTTIWPCAEVHCSVNTAL